MTSPGSADEHEPPSRTALAALERLAQHVDNYQLRHADHAIVAQFIYDIELEVVRGYSRLYAGIVGAGGAADLSARGELEDKTTKMRGGLHGVAMQLAALRTSVQVLLARLDELDAKPTSA